MQATISGRLRKPRNKTKKLRTGFDPILSFNDTLQQFAIFESFLQEGQELVAHIVEGGRVRDGKVAQASSV